MTSKGITEDQLKLANEFYNNDQQLTVDDRKQLFSSFRKNMYTFPVVVLPAIYAGLTLPSRFVRAPFLDAGRILGGMIGLFGGVTVSGYLGFQLGRSSLVPSSPSYNCYNILAKNTTPEVAVRYYRLTMQDPKLAMKTPASIDWKQGFPHSFIPDSSKLPEFQAPEGTLAAPANSKNELETPVPSSWDSIAKKSAPPAPPAPRTDQERFEALLEQERTPTDEFKDDFADDDKKW